MGISIYKLTDRQILSLCVLALLLLGVLMVESASAGVSNHLGWNWTPFATRHLIFAAVAFLTFLLVGAVDYSWLGRIPKHMLFSPVLWMLFIATAACGAVLVPHIGISENGARRWLPLGPLQVQPSELAKWAIVMFLAFWLSHRPLPLEKFFTGFIPTLIPIGLICLLIVIQDFGTAALIALCSMTMLLAGRVRTRHLLLVIPPVLAAAAWFLMHKEYRWRRVTAFLDPYAAPQKEGYHMIQSLLSFATGGVSGRGLGNGIQKLGYLPEDTTDFIFAVICEELGLFGAIFTIALYLGILLIAWQSIRNRRDEFGRMLAFGIASMVTLQAIINIAVATVSVPTKGLSLPLVSAGGSGLVITCAALGLLLSIARPPKPDPVEAPPAASPDPVPQGDPLPMPLNPSPV
jgi:cell division protein FtsW